MAPQHSRAARRRLLGPPRQRSWLLRTREQRLGRFVQQAHVAAGVAGREDQLNVIVDAAAASAAASCAGSCCRCTIGIPNPRGAPGRLLRRRQPPPAAQLAVPHGRQQVCQAPGPLALQLYLHAGCARVDLEGVQNAGAAKVVGPALVVTHVVPAGRQAGR
jgi:hypothetical protein